MHTYIHSELHLLIQFGALWDCVIVGVADFCCCCCWHFSPFDRSPLIGSSGRNKGFNWIISMFDWVQLEQKHGIFWLKEHRVCWHAHTRVRTAFILRSWQLLKTPFHQSPRKYLTNRSYSPSVNTAHLTVACLTRTPKHTNADQAITFFSPPRLLFDSQSLFRSCVFARLFSSFCFFPILFTELREIKGCPEPPHQPSPTYMNMSNFDLFLFAYTARWHIFILHPYLL